MKTIKYAVIFASVFCWIPAGHLISATNLSWNGRTAAVSLTFDDGDPCHTAIAIPELDKRGFKGTFFLIAKDIPGMSAGDKRQWDRAVSNGHELGDHSMTHPHPSGLTPKQLKRETLESKKIIEQNFGVTVVSYAYPFSEATPDQIKLVAKNFIAARTGGNDYYMTLDKVPDWSQLSSQVTLTRLDIGVYTNWLNEAVRRKAWIVFMIHGIEGTPWGWEPVPLKVFQQLLDYLKSREKDIWVAPFGEVAGYYREAVEKHPK